MTHRQVIVRLSLAASLVSSALSPAQAQVAVPASSDRIEIAAKRIELFVDTVARTKGSFPAIAVVIATPNSVPLMYVRGTVRAGSNAAVTARSEFYIASQTKAFVGLTAARLDQQHILPLDTTLRQIWPGLRLPAPADPAKITMRDLLTHQVPLKTDRLNFATAYVRSIPASEFSQLLATETSPRDPGFSYANLGYLIYGAALQARTGRPWRYWLKHEVLDPVGLSGVRASGSSNRNQAVWSHQWTSNGWVAYSPKPDSLKHSAGGLVSTPASLARWIQANLEPAAIDQRFASAVAFSHSKLVPAKLSDGEIRCEGYSLGWYNCGYKGEEFLLSTGEFVGTQSFTIIVPGRRVGMSLVASSDSQIQRMSLEMIKAFIGLTAGDQGELARLDRAGTAYSDWVKSLESKRSAAAKEERAAAKWGNWAWQPSAAEQQRIAGVYSDPVLGRVTVTAAKGKLTLRMGDLSARLEPAKPDLFAAWTNWSLTPDELAYDPATESLIFRGWRMARAH